ncbi:dipeptide transport system permease protein DppB [Liquorilactobacillus ghanensis DSM 18630]|uniref:Dipeptide transport system permease protein DppB n=2 Tax=Liquorilactobacillus ghanensis TaxID=399370 RepID=A0A0R1VWZ0_9LACO|nr:dipeptide transport system permease protein DppB [Liquorilactobacillus ghanensis DSM 18630]
MLPVDATRHDVIALNANLGLNHPLWMQYWDYLVSILQGNFGESLYYKQSVISLIAERLPATLSLAILAIIIAIVAGIIMGTISAIWKDSWLDHISTSFVFLIQSFPTFFIGILLIMIFAVKLRWFPTFGNDMPKAIILPALTLAAYPVAPITQTMRTSLIEVLDGKFVLAKQAMGFTDVDIVFNREIKNAMLPVLTIIGLELGTMIGGAVVTETVFSWPGIGQLVVQAVQKRDFPLIQATVIIISVFYIFINFAVDVLYFYLDPRVRKGKI